VAVWRGGNALASINEVDLHWARLVLGWVTVSGFNSWTVLNQIFSYCSGTAWCTVSVKFLSTAA